MIVFVNQMKVSMEIKVPEKFTHTYEQLIDINSIIANHVHRTKNKITKYYENKTWDRYKKLSNPYEMVFLSPNKRTLNASNYLPVSRSFFKLWEIMNDFNSKILKKDAMRVLFLAEGPGGFIEAFRKYRGDTAKDYCVGMTLKSSNKNVPDWKVDNFVKEYGVDQIGNLYNSENIRYMKDKYGTDFDLITADGGFDFSADFNNQEDASIELIQKEIEMAVSLQKEDGAFILKIYDMFHEQTLEVIQGLINIYKSIYIVKPYTSRPANSEKYLICIGFTGKRNFVPKKCDTQVLASIVSFNETYSKLQVQCIENTIQMIDNDIYSTDRAQVIYNDNKKKCLEWCDKYSI